MTPAHRADYWNNEEGTLPHTIGTLPTRDLNESPHLISFVVADAIDQGNTVRTTLLAEAILSRPLCGAERSGTKYFENSIVTAILSRSAGISLPGLQND